MKSFDSEATLFDMPGYLPQGPRTSLDRLEMVHGELGFIPHSMSELNYAMLGLDNRDVPGGYARHLNEVLLHQKKSISEDPTAALRSIVRKVKGFASTVRGDKTMLLQIQEELQDSLGVHNFLELNSLHNLSKWRDQPSTKRGLGLISREILVGQALQDKTMPNLDQVADEDAIEHVLGSIRVYEASNAITSAIEHSDARFAFWVECLESAKDHTVVRPLAFQALASLGIESAK